MVVGGIAAGCGPETELLERVGSVAGDTPIICGTGCKLENIEKILSCCHGAFVGSTFKKDGKFDNPIDVARVKEFMDVVKKWRG